MIDVILRGVLVVGAILMLLIFALAVLSVQDPDDLREEFFDDDNED